MITGDLHNVDRDNDDSNNNHNTNVDTDTDDVDCDESNFGPELVSSDSMVIDQVSVSETFVENDFVKIFEKKISTLFILMLNTCSVFC